MTIYLAGPMTGIPKFNHPAFDAAAAKLRAMGHTVFNPADNDRSLGIVPGEPESSSGFVRRAMMANDLEAICRSEAIALLPGWESSAGVAVELALAKYLGLKVLDAETGLELTK